MAQIKVKASSLVEVIVALVIITVSFAVCVVVFTQTGFSSYNRYENKGTEILHAYVYKTRLNKNFGNEKTKMESYWIKRTVTPYNNLHNLLLIEFEIADLSNRVFKKEKLLVLNEDVEE